MTRSPEEVPHECEGRRRRTEGRMEGGNPSRLCATTIDATASSE